MGMPITRHRDTEEEHLEISLAYMYVHLKYLVVLASTTVLVEPDLHP